MLVPTSHDPQVLQIVILYAMPISYTCIMTAHAQALYW